MMLKKLATTALLACVSSGAFALEARDADFMAAPPPRPGQGRCQEGNNVVQLNRWIQNNSIALRQVLNIGQECNGYVVRRVRIVATAQNRSFAQATLLVNGRAASYAQAIRQGRNSQAIDFQLNTGLNELGREIQTLQLSIQGSAYVERVAVLLERNPYGPGPGPGPGPRPGPGPNPPGPGPGPRPGPGPGPQPPYQYPVWSISAQGGYYDTTGRIQGAMRLPMMRQYGGTLVSGEPVPMVPVVVNAMGHICNIPATAPGLGVCTNVPTHYE